MSATMSTLTAEFFGGPQDGQIREMQPEITGAGREDWQPPIAVHFDRFCGYRPDGSVIVIRELYLRRLNPRDDGTLWEYLYCPA